MVKIEEGQLRQLLNTAAELGAKSALTAAGLNKTEISRAEAIRRFSKRSVDGWINNGKIKIVKRGSSSKLNLMQLEVLASTNDLYSKHLKTTV